jgi:hypothetical protein
MPRSWSIASKNKVTEPHRPSTTTDTRFRSSDKAIDLKKLLAVYDDYPVVVSNLERAHDALDRAEDDARVAEERKEQADQDSRLRRKRGRPKGNKRRRTRRMPSSERIPKSVLSLIQKSRNSRRS